MNKALVVSSLFFFFHLVLAYYFDLIDVLSKLKIIGIIVEFEDKLKYQSRPEVGSSDAMSIDWWGRLSDYAIERNAVSYTHLTLPTKA